MNLDDIRARHIPYNAVMQEGPVCNWCEMTYPCDAESQHPGGWGPDVTTVAILRTLLADTATASEEPQDKPSHRHDWVAWGGDGTWDYCTDPDCRATRSHWEDPR
jgi:hypothetical protein